MLLWSIVVRQVSEAHSVQCSTWRTVLWQSTIQYQDNSTFTECRTWRTTLWQSTIQYLENSTFTASAVPGEQQSLQVVSVSLTPQHSATWRKLERVALFQQTSPYQLNPLVSSHSSCIWIENALVQVYSLAKNQPPSSNQLSVRVYKKLFIILKMSPWCNFLFETSSQKGSSLDCQNRNWQ